MKTIADQLADALRFIDKELSPHVEANHVFFARNKAREALLIYDSRPVKKVCAHCGSDDVVMEAAVRWDAKKQEWCDVSTVYDGSGHCEKCSGETTIEDRDFTAEDPFAAGYAG